MEKDAFDGYLEAHSAEIDTIKNLAHDVHRSVNQYYDKRFPYSVHLDSVARYVAEYGHGVCQREEDVLPLMFGAYFHDSIEDARLTYNDVRNLARQQMSESQALMAAEIAYALTNEKGRTRAERASDRYYQGIRATPYAPLCKMADRLANVSFSAGNLHGSKPTMRSVYAAENCHFLEGVLGLEPSPDPRMRVPAEMVERLTELLK